MTAEDKQEELRELSARTSKQCGKCLLTKPRAAFAKRSRSRDGMASECKSCTADRHRTYRVEDPEGHRERWRDYYARNVNEERERARVKYLQNREAFAERNKRWADANRDHLREWQARRRAAIRGSEVEKVDTDALWTGWCGICGASMDRAITHPDPMSPSLDHIIPVSKGGPHVASNLQWAHLTCNTRKGASLP